MPSTIPTVRISPCHHAPTSCSSISTPDPGPTPTWQRGTGKLEREWRATSRLRKWQSLNGSCSSASCSEREQVLERCARGGRNHDHSRHLWCSTELEMIKNHELASLGHEKEAEGSVIYDSTLPVMEKIMRVPYGADKEYFKYSLFLVFCNRITTSAVSAGALLASKKALDPVAPVYKYCLISVSNILTTTCQYEALKYVSFPVQTLAKCAKMIPVMVWGTLIMQKRIQGT
uniref:UDP-galactose/UDP-glucose transporter 5B n=1 Tax=Vitis vinifera TaxID=29760 RepID=A5ARE2_VITVI|nr:hypothetical protein VITISV_003137 [Vitis vinifera]